MSDISIPGFSQGKYKTDEIIAGLVKTKEVQLERMQQDRDDFTLRRSIWQSINNLTNRLETSASILYNVDNPFRHKFSTSSDESVLTVSNNRQAENREYTLRVLQIAKPDSLRSDELAADWQVSPGSYTLAVGQESQSFSFGGGSLKQFAAQANRALRGMAQFQVVPSREQKQILILTAQDSGLDKPLHFAAEARQLALDTGMILADDSLRLDLLKESLIAPFNALSEYHLSQSKDQVSIAPGQELRISLPNSYTVRPASVMRYQIWAPREELPPISNTPDNQFFPPPPQTSAPPQPGGQLGGQFRSKGPIEIPVPPAAELEDLRIESAGSDFSLLQRAQPAAQPPSSSSRITQNNANSQSRREQQGRQGIIDGELLNPTANFYFVQQDRRLPAGPKDGEVQAASTPHEEIFSLNSLASIRNWDSLSSLNSSGSAGPRISELIIRNPNPDREIVIGKLRFENPEARDDMLFAHPISRAQNAKISYLGVDVERSGNQVDDLLPGLTLQLHKPEPEKDITIRTQPDYDAITKKVAEFVSAYNDLMTQLNIVNTSNDAVIREKTSFSEKQEEEARQVLGLLRGDSNVNNLKYRLVSSIADGYPTVLGTRTLVDAGISTNLSGFQSSIDQSKLRGYLELDTEVLRQALEENFDMVRDLFGRDNDGDFIVDSGSALQIQQIGRGYTQPNGPIPYQVKDLQQNVTDSERRIDDYKTYLADYEQDLRRKYGRMEGALNQLNQQQQSLENFSKSMNR